jgi:integrase
MPLLTDAHVKALPAPEAGAQYHWDDPKVGLPGFGLRITAAGARTWQVRYRAPDGRQRIIALAPIAAMKAAAARKLAGEYVIAARAGLDKAAETELRKAAAKAASVADVADAYMKHCERRGLRPATLESIRRSLGVMLKPLADTPAGMLTRQQVSRWRDAIAVERGPRSADLAGGALSAALAHAMQRGEIDANVAAGIPKADFAGARTRVLTDAELAMVWRHAGRPGDDFADMVRLLILTGARKNEVGGMTRSEIEVEDSGRWLWRLPAARNKGKRDRELPLPMHAAAILQPRLATARQNLFGSAWQGEGRGFSGWSRSKARLDGRLQRAGWAGPAWTLHDLRRTVRTGLARLGVQPHVAELCIGHALAGAVGQLAAIYDRHGYDAEIANALALWVEHVDAVFAADDAA